MNAEMIPDAPLSAAPEINAASPVEPVPAISQEITRVKFFLFVQSLLLVVTAFTGAFNSKLLAMLDTALLIESIGLTSLILVLDEDKHRRLAFKTAVVLYLIALLDMGINVLISGVVGSRT